MTRVVRSNLSRWIPCNLLVRGDLIQLALGDVAPSKIQWISSIDTKVLEWYGYLSSLKWK
jgi:hypothetical protein